MSKEPCSKCRFWYGHGCYEGYMPAYLRPKPHDCFRTKRTKPILVQLEPPAFDW